MSLNEFYTQDNADRLTAATRTYKIYADELQPGDRIDIPALEKTTTEVVVWAGDEKTQYSLSPTRPDEARLLAEKLASLAPNRP